MKKRILLTTMLVLVLALLFAISAFAVDITVDGLTYALTDGVDGADNTAKIKSNEGKTLSVTDIVIPEYVEYEGAKYYVTEMASYCFKKSNVTTVRFDDKCRITTIPSGAFNTCESLTLIDFGKAGITTVGGNAFAFSRQLLFKDNRMPSMFSTFSGTQHFDGCNAMVTLIFPETFTEFDCDTRIQNSGILNLVFEGRMTKVFLQYNKKHNSGGMSVYLTKNSSSELNGSIVETLIHNNAPYYKNVKDAYTVKTDGYLTIKWSGSDANSSGTSQATIDGFRYNAVNTNQDKIYFCGDDSISFIVRTSVISGSWTSGYVATYKTNSLDPSGETNANVTYKMASSHFLKETINQDANCLYPASRTEMCHCGDVISRVVLGTELGDHTYTDDFDCTTEHICSVCEDLIIEAIEHNLLTEILYASYGEDGTKSTTCQNEGCNHGITVVAKSLFTNLGYSTKEYSNGGIGITFIVNYDAINDYKSIMGKEIKFGVFAVSKAKLGDNEIMNASGDTADGVVSADFSKHSYDVIALRITGFETETHKNAKLAFGAYVIENGENVSYLQADAPDDGAKYSFVTFNELA